MKKSIILIAITILLAGFSACIPSPPSPGFRITTHRTTIQPGNLFPSEVNAPNIFVNGNVTEVFCCVQIQGTVGAFSGSTNGSSYYDLAGGKTPAHWRLGEGSGPCSGQSVNVTIIYAGSTQPLNCRDVPITFFNFAPSMIERAGPPATITIEGTDISTAGGMPTVEYYDLNGTLITQDTATDVSGGTVLTAPAPNVSLFGSGAYIALVRNANGSSPGNGVLVIFDYYEPPYEPPPDPPTCGGEEICMIN